MINADDVDHDDIREELQVSQQRYQNLVEAMPAILYEFSDEVGSIYFSPQVEDILGYKVSYLLEHPKLWHESIHPEDVQKVNNAIANVQSKPINLEYRVQDASGNWRWFYDYS